jgi:hypothetical protein
VRAQTGQVFELLYGELSDQWRVHPA